MTLITVNDDLAREIAGASLPIVFVDANGRRLAEITQLTSEPELPPGLTHERWEEIQRRMKEPGEYVTFQEVKDKLGW